jgi:hypothetical protein
MSLCCISMLYSNSECCISMLYTNSEFGLFIFRLEIYCGKKQHITENSITENREATPQAEDQLSGPAAVTRNLQQLNIRDNSWRVVITDRFYTSVKLALALLDMRFYTVGTIMTNRLGFCKDVIDRRKARPTECPRGEYKMAFCTELPKMIALSWMDSKPVHMLATGSGIGEGTVGRRNRRGLVRQVSCPKAMMDYHKWMGGVDVHDQLRLQRYSLQLALRFKKYYKSLFLGLVDMALVNAFIVYKYKKTQHEEQCSRDNFLSVLQNQLLSITEDEFEQECVLQHHEDEETDQPSVHFLQESPDYQEITHRDGSTTRKRRQRACKVCSLLKSGSTRSSNSKLFCQKCSNGLKRIYLCDRIRRQESGNQLTCFQIWHDEWGNGQAIPASITRSIQIRSVFTVPGKKKRRRNYSMDC